MGYAYSFGNVLLDPAIPITGGQAKLHTVVGAYLRSIDFFGKSAKIDVIVPWAGSDRGRGAP